MRAYGPKNQFSPHYVHIHELFTEDGMEKPFDSISFTTISTDKTMTTTQHDRNCRRQAIHEFEWIRSHWIVTAVVSLLFLFCQLLIVLSLAISFNSSPSLFRSIFLFFLLIPIRFVVCVSCLFSFSIYNFFFIHFTLKELLQFHCTNSFKPKKLIQVSRF